MIHFRLVDLIQIVKEHKDSTASNSDSEDERMLKTNGLGNSGTLISGQLTNDLKESSVSSAFAAHPHASVKIRDLGSIPRSGTKESNLKRRNSKLQFDSNRQR